MHYCVTEPQGEPSFSRTKLGSSFGKFSGLKIVKLLVEVALAYSFIPASRGFSEWHGTWNFLLFLFDTKVCLKDLMNCLCCAIR